MSGLDCEGLVQCLFGTLDVGLFTQQQTVIVSAVGKVRLGGNAGVIGVFGSLMVPGACFDPCQVEEMLGRWWHRPGGFAQGCEGFLERTSRFEDQALSVESGPMGWIAGKNLTIQPESTVEVAGLVHLEHVA
tara:strand:- start:11513 stop:11908 length:396 start_codon:yes stop_codon:yes gene_type:complete